MVQLGRIPQVGDKVEVDCYRFEVIDMDRNRVDKLLVTQLEASPSVIASSSGNNTSGEASTGR